MSCIQAFVNPSPWQDLASAFLNDPLSLNSCRIGGGVLGSVFGRVRSHWDFSKHPLSVDIGIHA